MAETGYNGWANYETWAVGMFLDGNYDGEGTYRYVLDVVREAAKAGEVGRSTAIADVADAIREVVETSVSEATDGLASGLAADLLSAACGSVDWREIAESRLPDDFYSADELAEWSKEATDIGKEHAENSAGWSFDGNSDPVERAKVLEMLRDGDPAAWDYVPAMPNLSGEMADDATPASLFEQISGLDAGAGEYDDAIDALAAAYEEAVSEAYGLMCEAALAKFCAADAA